MKSYLPSFSDTKFTFQGLRRKLFFLVVGFFLFNTSVFSQDETFPAGAFVINMGVTPQTINHLLKP